MSTPLFINPPAGQAVEERLYTFEEARKHINAAIHKENGIPFPVIDAWNKRDSAYHEAGHAIVALMLGFSDISATIAPAYPDSMVFREWAGRCAFANRPLSYPDALRLAAALPIVGVAGLIAEMMMSNDWDSFDWRDIETCLDEVDLRRVVGSDITKVAQQAEKILKSNWNLVEEAARILMMCNHLSEAQIKVLGVRGNAPTRASLDPFGVRQDSPSPKNHGSKSKK